VVDGSSASYHTLSGNSRKTLLKLEVSLPKKHGRGGQSKNRFARIREEKIGWYISKVCSLAIKHFIDPATSLPNVDGIILAGSAQLKDDVNEKLDQRLSRIVIGVVDIQYGGESGFNQAINLSQSKLSNLKLVNEQKLLSAFFEEIARDGNYCIGIDDSMYALTSGLVDKFILWPGITHLRIEMVSVADPEKNKIVYYKPDDPKLCEYTDWKIISSVPLVDWILENYKNFGAVVEIVSDQTDVGSQFVKGFGGLGGFLRYEAELPSTSKNNLDVDDDEEYVW